MAYQRASREARDAVAHAKLHVRAAQRVESDADRVLAEVAEIMRAKCLIERLGKIRDTNGSEGLHPADS